MRLDCLDLYLIHFPIALAFVPFDVRYPPEWFHDPAAPQPAMKPIKVPYADTWRAMEDLVREPASVNAILLRILRNLDEAFTRADRFSERQFMRRLAVRVMED